MKIAGYRMQPIPVYASLVRNYKRVLEAVHRHPSVVLDVDGKITPSSFINADTIDNERELMLSRRWFGIQDGCMICRAMHRRRYNEYGRIEGACDGCLRTFRILKLRGIFKESLTVSLGVRKALREKYTFEELDALWKTQDPSVIDITGRSIYPKGSAVGMPGFPRRWVYEEDGLFYYYRCPYEHCRSILKTRKSGFYSPMSGPGFGDQGPRLNIDRAGHCRTCCFCNQHAYLAFEPAPERRKARKKPV